MRKEADVFIFLMPGDLLDSGFPLYVAPSGAIVAQNAVPPSMISCIIGWDSTMYRWVPFWSRGMLNFRPQALPQLLRQENLTEANLPVETRADGLPISWFDYVFHQTVRLPASYCPYCRREMPLGCLKCFACFRDFAFRQPDACADHVGAGGGACTGHAGAGAAGSAEAAVAAPAVGMEVIPEHPEMVQRTAEGFSLSQRAERRLREEAFAQVRQSHGVTDEIRRLKQERYGVTSKRSGFGKFYDNVKLNRKWQRQMQDDTVCRERALLGALREVRGFHRTGPWVPDRATSGRPASEFRFEVSDAKILACTQLLGNATGAADQSAEDKARWDLAIERVKALYELDATTVMDVVHHLAPGRDFSSMTEESQTDDLSALEFAGVVVYEMATRSMSGYFPVWPWDA